MFKTVKKILSTLATLSTLLFIASIFNNSNSSYLHGLIKIEHKGESLPNTQENTNAFQSPELQFLQSALNGLMQKLSDCDKVKNLYIAGNPPGIYKTKCYVYTNQDLMQSAQEIKKGSKIESIIFVVPFKTNLEFSSALLKNYDLLTVNTEGKITNIINASNCKTLCAKKQVNLERETLLVLPAGTIDSHKITYSTKIGLNYNIQNQK